MILIMIFIYCFPMYCSFSWCFTPWIKASHYATPLLFSVLFKQYKGFLHHYSMFDIRVFTHITDMRTRVHKGVMKWWLHWYNQKLPGSMHSSLEPKHDPFLRLNICINECVWMCACVCVRTAWVSDIRWEWMKQRHLGGWLSCRVIFGVNKDEMKNITPPLRRYLLLHMSAA